MGEAKRRKERTKAMSERYYGWEHPHNTPEQKTMAWRTVVVRQNAVNLFLQVFQLVALIAIAFMID